MSTSNLFILLILLSATFSVCSGDDPAVTNTVKCTTTKGDLTIDIYRDWAPLGADRFIELVQDGFFQDIGLFRCVKKFLTQFGISDKPQYKHWHYEEIPDDPNLHKGIKKNYLSFAGGGPNTRSTQLFIAFEDLDFLGNEPWETPFGMVTEGQETLDSLFKGYGDIPPFGKGPDQQKIHNRGNQYLRDNFPKLDYILSCEVVVNDLIAQTPFTPDTQRHNEEEQQEEIRGEAQTSPNEQESKEVFEEIAEQTPFDPQAAAIAEADVTVEISGINLRASNVLSGKMDISVYVFRGVLFLIGTIAAFVLAVQLRKRLAAVSKDN